MAFEIPNIRHLRVFLEVVQCKSISKASEKVFLSQPAITQAIAKLEASLGTVLFQRRSDGMFVAESGELFATRVKRAMDMILAGLKGAVRLGGSKAQPLHLLQQLTTTQLRALIAVTEAHNFSIAGRNLGISQSSLHRAARELEGLLGVELFEKTSTGISSTKAARALAKSCKLAFSEIVQGRDEVDALHHREVGQLVIGSMPLARTSLLPKAIIGFSEQFPDFRLKVNDGPYDDLLYHLRHGDIDILLGALRFPAPADDVLQEELFSSPVAIVARPGHPLCRPDSGHIDLETLQKYPWVVPHEGTPTRAIFESLFSESGMEVPERLVESGSQVLIRSLLVGSDRLTIISQHQIQHELSTGILKPVPYDLVKAYRPIGVTVRKSWRPTNTQLSFVNELRIPERLNDVDDQ
ncbi:LysR family transcriptional regulator [Amphritea japonica]|uniref:LysR family transcriptional regulator n=1 Tax=Amphritea japonica ATCC BAA-1530 TaxID=1278309 RepID=A0A7R6SRZ8_9GAMM|nr:LysR family transcriptional regulator [Amphritea japonica]BBB25784.1 LysR family transcriptional regulator [Amphritea japonica ATCC BAA-1530]